MPVMSPHCLTSALWGPDLVLGILVPLDPDGWLVDLLLVHDDVAVLRAAEDVVDAEDGLLVLVLCVADQSGAHLHPGVATPPVEEPEVCGHHLTFLYH